MQRNTLVDVDGVKSQHCRDCKKLLSLSAYYKNKQRPFGHEEICKACRKVRTANHYKEYGAVKCAKLKAARLRDPRKFVLTAAKCRAKRLDVPFALTIEDVVIPEFCPILGLPLKINEGRPKANSPSLDRIVPALGYVRDNVVVISYRANLLKNNATMAELRAIVNYVEQYTRKETL